MRKLISDFNPRCGFKYEISETFVLDGTNKFDFKRRKNV